MEQDKKTYTAQAKWQQKNIETVSIKVNKRHRLSERIEALVSTGKAKSRQAYIIEAVLNQLQKDEE